LECARTEKVAESRCGFTDHRRAVGPHPCPAISGQSLPTVLGIAPAGCEKCGITAAANCVTADIRSVRRRPYSALCWLTRIRLKSSPRGQLRRRPAPGCIASAPVPARRRDSYRRPRGGLEFGDRLAWKDFQIDAACPLVPGLWRLGISGVDGHPDYSLNHCSAVWRRKGLLAPKRARGQARQARVHVARLPQPVVIRGWSGFRRVRCGWGC
jgi:hypothetical protein